ncbi:MAG: glycosyltransferase [Deltaproteobacteria bacterium]|nr:glycosyltransferase [Deltaproteobacteria bacterium]
MINKISSVIQLTHTLTIGDAISDSILSMHETFMTIGLRSSIVAQFIHRDLANFASRLSDKKLSADLVILHFSIGGWIILAFKRSSARIKGMVFHNITPPVFFDGVNQRVLRHLKSGISSLKKVSDICDFFIADSYYNLKTLSCYVGDLGSKPRFVLPLKVNRKKFQKPTLLDKLNWFLVPKQLKKRKAKLLFVGRIAPNKNLEDCIRVLAKFKRSYEGDTVFWLAGTYQDCELYRAKLEAIISYYQLQDSVIFWGPVSEGFLQLLYKNASAYLAFSKHEGFCVPVIEAFAYGLPVIGFKCSGLAETMGKRACFVFPRSVNRAARIIHRVVFNPSFKNRILRCQSRRLSYFSEEKFTERLKSILTSLNDFF